MYIWEILHERNLHLRDRYQGLFSDEESVDRGSGMIGKSRVGKARQGKGAGQDRISLLVKLKMVHNNTGPKRIALLGWIDTPELSCNNPVWNSYGTFRTKTISYQVISSKIVFFTGRFFTARCRIVFAIPEDLEMWPYHLRLLFFTMVRRSSCTPIAFWILLRTSSFVTWSL